MKILEIYDNTNFINHICDKHKDNLNIYPIVDKPFGYISYINNDVNYIRTRYLFIQNHQINIPNVSDYSLIIHEFAHIIEMKNKNRLLQVDLGMDSTPISNKNKFDKAKLASLIRETRTLSIQLFLKYNKPNVIKFEENFNIIINNVFKSLINDSYLIKIAKPSSFNKTSANFNIRSFKKFHCEHEGEAIYKLCNYLIEIAYSTIKQYSLDRIEHELNDKFHFMKSHKDSVDLYDYFDADNNFKA